MRLNKICLLLCLFLFSGCSVFSFATNDKRDNDIINSIVGDWKISYAIDKETNEEFCQGINMWKL